MRIELDFIGMQTTATDTMDGLFSHIDTGMWVLFILGISALFTYSWKTRNETKGVKKYFILSVPNILFHLIASTIVFLTLEETGEHIIRKFFPDFDPSKTYDYMLSALTGMFGSVFMALIFELGKIMLEKAKKIIS